MRSLVGPKDVHADSEIMCYPASNGSHSLAHLHDLRETQAAALYSNPEVAAAYVTCRVRASTEETPAGSGQLPAAPSCDPPPPSDQSSRDWPTQKAAKVWFYTEDRGKIYVLCHERGDSDPQHPQFDTFGGKMDSNDGGLFVDCARRELADPSDPPPWYTLI